MTSWWAGVRARVPRIEFERGPAHAPSAVTTYYLIVVPALLLAAIGLLMGFSASAVTTITAGRSPYVEFLKPAGIIVFSLLVASAVQLVPEGRWYRTCGVIFVVALFVQSLVLTPLGLEVGGNRNWLVVPGIPVQLQPSEFVKLALVLALARVVTRRGARIGDLGQMAATAGALMALAIGFVMLGQDMGTAIIVAAAGFGVLLVAGVPGKWFAWLGIAAVPVLAFLVVKNPTRLARVLAILPGGSQSTTNLSAPTQIDHALWALGSGGLTGLGPGASREKWNYLQAANTDFVFAIIGEEFGLLGTLTVIVCLGLLVWGMARVAQNHATAFGRAVGGGVATWIAVQGLINVASVTGMGPVIGVPLPLVSYGGSSFLFTATAVAVVASLARSDAGMRLIGQPDEASAGRDPRRAPRRRRARPGAGPVTTTTAGQSIREARR